MSEESGWVWIRWQDPVTQFFAPRWVIMGSDQNKYLFLWENRSNLGCFFLLKSAFQGQKQHCKNFIKAFPSSEHQYFKIEIIFSNEMVVLGVLR